MAATVLSIVNAARGRAGLGKSPLTASQFDATGNISKDITILKSEFARLYAELASFKKDDFRQLFSIITSNGVNDYLPGIDFSQIVDIDLRVVSNPINSSPWLLAYVSEEDVINRYPNPTLIPLGQPYQWWTQTTNNQSIKYLSFVSIPNGVYTITGVQSLRAETLTANQATKCIAEGDKWLEDRLYERILFSDGLAPDIDNFSHQSKMLYISISQSQDVQGDGYFPAQDGVSRRDAVIWR